MALIKKIDLFLLKSFLGLFLMTFFICIFIFLMQFVWMHVNDLVGKGVAISILAEFFVYAVATVVPMALPLAILLASLMTFGNMGERFELTAMKAAGISLFRIMRPLIIAIMFICFGAFYFSNNVLPVTQVKLWTLIFSLRQKSPELDIPTGEFYDGISGYNMYVGHKNPSSGMMYDIMLYNYSEGFQNASVMVADSGRMYFTEDQHYLLFCLYSGESFENIDNQQQRATKSQSVPYRRETYSSKTMLIDFSTEFSRYDESVLADQHVAKNMSELIYSIDSVSVLAHERSREQSMQLINSKYVGREYSPGRVLPPADELLSPYTSVDSVFASLPPKDQLRAVDQALERARAQRDQVDYNFLLLDEFRRYIRKHAIELHRKFTLAFACLIFFFIGAPFGAIIRKGGFGMPVVVSVVMFIVYYIIDNTGFKMAREALWPVWAGMWLSSFVLLPIGIFLTYKATTDSDLFRKEAWLKQWEKWLPYFRKLKNKSYEYYQTSYRGLQAWRVRHRRG